MGFPKRTAKAAADPTSRRARTLRFIRNVGIWTGALVVLTAAAGVAYTWYMGQQPLPQPVAEAAPAAEFAEPVSAAKHIAPDPNARASAAIQMLTSPVMPGMNASINVKTNANAECAISVTYNNIASKDSGLSPKTADEFGLVSWAWTVEPSVPYGKWPVKITCEINKKSAVVQGDLEVAKQVN